MIRDDDKLYDPHWVEWGVKDETFSRFFFSRALRSHDSRYMRRL